MSTDNPLLTLSPLPFQLPPFEQIKPEHYGPAFDQGMAEQLAQVQAITENPEPATFANTIEALERSGRTLDRTATVFFSLISSLSSPELRELETEYAPRLAAHSDAIRLHRGLFARIDAVHAGRAETALTPEQRQLVERYHLDFVLAGARLDQAGQARLAELNQAISVASTRFQQNLQAATEAAALHLADREQLRGLSEEAVQAAERAAADRGYDGGYLLPLVLPSGQPALAELDDRQVRERLYRASVDRAGAERRASGASQGPQGPRGVATPERTSGAERRGERSIAGPPGPKGGSDPGANIGR